MKNKQDVPDLAALSLLDDHSRDATDKKELRAWQDLTLRNLKAKPVKATPAKSQPKPAPQKKFFASSPTLRQMMAEYNRPTNRFAPIKADAPASKPETDDFTFDTIRQIRVPQTATGGIPGRILRPSRSGKTQKSD
jgi:hypothetical protein